MTAVVSSRWQKRAARKTGPGMKRLVTFGLAMALAGSTYAQEPMRSTAVYNFTANVKNTNIKTVKVPVPITFTVGKAKPPRPTVDVLVKYVQSTMLYGYIIDGSRRIDADFGGQDWVWAVIANMNVTPAIGHLFEVTPVQIRIFDPSLSMPNPTPNISPEDMLRIRFGAEGGFIMNQGEDWPGDNVLFTDEGGEETPLNGKYYYPVNQNYLFGQYDTWGSAWFAAVGFGTARFISNPGYETQFHLSMDGSIIGGWRDDQCNVDAWIDGYDMVDVLGDERFHMSSWIAGTWSIRPNQRLRPLTASDGQTTYGPCYTAAALKAINPAQDFDEADRKSVV